MNFSVDYIIFSLIISHTKKKLFNVWHKLVSTVVMLFCRFVHTSKEKMRVCFSLCSATTISNGIKKKFVIITNEIIRWANAKINFTTSAHSTVTVFSLSKNVFTVWRFRFSSSEVLIVRNNFRTWYYLFYCRQIQPVAIHFAKLCPKVREL